MRKQKWCRLYMSGCILYKYSLSKKKKIFPKNFFFLPKIGNPSNKVEPKKTQNECYRGEGTSNICVGEQKLP